MRWVPLIALWVLLSPSRSVWAQGPDVTVVDLPNAGTFGTDGSGIFAYSIATTACNAGDEVISWIGGTAEHPVIAQHLYRYRADRFEQIGLSWVKHGVSALDLFAAACGTCSPTGDIAYLGVGCTDPYSATANGLQTRLGPRSVVDVRTGDFPFPIGIPDYDPIIGRRLQVHVEDIDPLLNPGAIYIAEAHYISADDALAGNSLNNQSHRRAMFADDPDHTLTLFGPVSIAEPAIQA
ncbi:MAG: hypothetical protein KDC38_17720, partial [Planctomycetes bacterium]|nr:hypothetical protein [Planctomycetota bacterium]